MHSMASMAEAESERVLNNRMLLLDNKEAALQLDSGYGEPCQGHRCLCWHIITRRLLGAYAIGRLRAA